MNRFPCPRISNEGDRGSHGRRRVMIPMILTGGVDTSPFFFFDEICMEAVV